MDFVLVLLYPSWTMSKITILLGLLFLSTFTWADQVLQLPNHRVVAYESFKADADGPVFIFLPGIYRGFNSNEAFVQSLQKHDIPYVLMNFAEHPDSVAKTGKETPSFADVTAKTLADEVSALAKELKIKQAVPVTLSYSAIVTSHFDTKLFPVVIETAPISTDTDGLPANVAAFYEYWKYWVLTVPFYGPIWLDQTKTAQLRQHWEPQVQEYAKERLPELQSPEYHERALQGYIALSKASEGFDLRRQDFAKGPKRFFVLGEKEASARLKAQQEAIAKYEKVIGISNLSVIVPQAGHAVPVDQPEAFVEVIQNLRKVLTP